MQKSEGLKSGNKLYKKQEQVSGKKHDFSSNSRNFSIPDVFANTAKQFRFNPHKCKKTKFNSRKMRAAEKKSNHSPAIPYESTKSNNLKKLDEINISNNNKQGFQFKRSFDTTKRNNKKNKKKNSNKANHDKQKTLTSRERYNQKLRIIQTIRERKEKANTQHKKQERNNISNENLQIISIEDSDCESDKTNDDDVICVPLPTPPLVEVYESDEEVNIDDSQLILKNQANNGSTNLKIEKSLTPNNNQGNDFQTSISARVSVEQSNNSSRCTSPSSSFSTDDFITQREKSRLIEAPNVNVEDFIISETVDSFVQRLNKPEVTSEQLAKFNKLIMPPPSLSMQKKKVERVFCETSKKNREKPDILVKENCFRAVDVYAESESDISVYSKGSVSNKADFPKDNTNAVGSHSSSSSSSLDYDEIDIVQKVKRFRKRRCSNKDKEKLSSDDDSENEFNQCSTGLPYITKGEAVDSAKKRRRTSSSNVNSNTLNYSDKEFISQLTNIIQNKQKLQDISTKSNESDISEPDQNGITARKLAEDVINNTKKKKESETILYHQKDHTESKTIQESAISSNETTNNEVFEKSINKTNLVLQKIDETNKEMESMNVEEIWYKDTIPLINLDTTENSIEYKKDEIEILNTEDSGNKLLMLHNHVKSIEVDGIPYYMVHCQSTDNLGWCEEMMRFYNNSWGGENFDVEKIKQSLDKKANWNINSADRYPTLKKNKRLKCFNCCAFGHTTVKCPHPKKAAVCYMCGEQGHREPRCPNTICLKCGRKTAAFTRGCRKCSFQNNILCHTCKQLGHTSRFCPDKWRRYHSTITNTDPVNRVIYNKIKYCCVCAGKGHLPENCKYAKIYCEYQPSSSQIKSYTRIFEENKKDNLLRDTITYNLLYIPNNAVMFSFSQNKEFHINGYYGRFLKTCKLFQSIDTKTKTLNEIDNTHNESNNEDRNQSDEPLYVLHVNKLNTNDIETDSKIKLLDQRSKTLQKRKDIDPKSNKTIANAEEPISLDQQFKYPMNIKFTKKNETNKGEIGSCCDDLNDRNKEMDSESILKESKADNNELVVDSDSNYSFSDHFDIPKKSTSTSETVEIQEKIVNSFEVKSRKIDLSKPQRISKPMCETLEFIPFNSSEMDTGNKNIDGKNTNDNDTTIKRKHLDEQLKENFLSFIDNTKPSEHEHNTKDQITEYSRTRGISHRLRHLTESDMDEPASFPNESYIGKIYLPKNLSEYFLSSEGNKFLVEKSNMCSVKASFEWTSVGNVLVIEGTQDDQNEFHALLMTETRNLTNKLKNDELQKSLRVPRKRSVLIDFLKQDLERLDKSLGNVWDLRRQLQNYEFQQSKNGLKQAQKIRTKLNMILLGQAGLRDGKHNLNFLIRSLIILIHESKSTDQIENITNETRNEIDRSWKYIFGPFEHTNYDELIKDYYHLKRKNNLPALNICDQIKYGNKTEISIIKNSNINLNKSINKKVENILIEQDSEIPKFEEKNHMKRNSLEISDLNSELNEISNMKIPKLFLNITGTSNNSSCNSSSFTSFLLSMESERNSNNVNETITKNDGNVQNPYTLNRIESMLQRIVVNSSSASGKEVTQIVSAKIPSLFWSRESDRLLEIIRKKNKWSDSIESKLQTLLNSAQIGLLSHNDYKDILKILGLTSSVVKK